MKKRKIVIIISTIVLIIVVFICVKKRFLTDISEKIEYYDVSAFSQYMLPDRISYERENAVFDFVLEVPKNVDWANIPIGKVKGIAVSNNEDTFKVWNDNYEIAEIQELDTVYSDEPKYLYSFNSDKAKTLITGDISFLYNSQKHLHYSNVFNVADENLTDDKALEFANVADCYDDILGKLKAMGLPYEIELFSDVMLYDEIAETEYHINHDGNLIYDQYKEEWTKEDSAYVVWGRQLFENFPILNQTMGIGGVLSFECPAAHVVRAVYTARGIEYFAADTLYNLEKTGEYKPINNFNEILARVDQKLSNVLSAGGFEVYRAKFYQHVCLNKKNKLEMIPVWYFECRFLGEQSYETVLIINALNGEIISNW